MPRDFTPTTKPTMYFIGVTTGHSSINRVFPRWADRLGLGDCELRGLDFPLSDAYKYAAYDAMLQKFQAPATAPKP